MGDDEREPKKGMVKQRKRKGKMFITKGVKMKGKFLGIVLVVSWICVCLLVSLLCSKGM